MKTLDWSTEDTFEDLYKSIKKKYSKGDILTYFEFVTEFIKVLSLSLKKSLESQFDSDLSQYEKQCINRFTIKHNTLLFLRFRNDDGFKELTEVKKYCRLAYDKTQEMMNSIENRLKEENYEQD